MNIFCERTIIKVLSEVKKGENMCFLRKTGSFSGAAKKGERGMRKKLVGFSSSLSLAKQVTITSINFLCASSSFLFLLPTTH